MGDKESDVSVHDYLDRVVDRTTFVEFVAALIDDREAELAKVKERPSSPYGAGPNGWENGTIEDFLLAALRWAEAFGKREGGLPEEPGWKAFATFLYCGKIYE